MAQISLAWTLVKEPVAAPIIGTTSLQNLEDILGEYWPLSFLTDLDTRTGGR